MVGAGPAAMNQPEGAPAVLDGDHGVLYVEPSEDDLRAARAAQSSLADLRDAERRTRYEPAITTDGARIEVVANTGLAKEAAQAVEAGGEGIGLMRSEFLFLERDSAPSEDEQYRAYRRGGRGAGRPAADPPHAGHRRRQGGALSRSAGRGQPVPRRARHPPLPRLSRAVQDPAAGDLPRRRARTDQDHVSDDLRRSRTCARRWRSPSRCARSWAPGSSSSAS